MVASRRDARDRALVLLYEADIKGVPATEVLAALPVVPDPFCVELVRAADSARDRADALVDEVAVGWEVERMPVVDRNILRMAVAELEAFPATPVAVVIDEAVELAKRYSTDESGAFVNGVLSTVAARLRPERADRSRRRESGPASEEGP